MAAESSSNRGKKESTAALSSSPRQDDDVKDLVKSLPHSPNNSSTSKVCAFTTRAFFDSWAVYSPMHIFLRTYTSHTYLNMLLWWFIQFVDGFFSPIYERLGIDRDDRDEELCSVYVPTNHLYIGDVFLVNSKEIYPPQFIHSRRH
ncbi:hypothetical protein STAS_10684, partial [Striga asiatica]